jgi:hypothetical protein
MSNKKSIFYRFQWQVNVVQMVVDYSRHPH